jgi:hypothetical protein
MDCADDDDEKDTLSKFILCVLRTQSGKTFQAIQKIKTELEQDKYIGRSLHVIFTMNTLLNNKQFAKRLETIEEKYGKGSICIFSSKCDLPYTHVTDKLKLQGLCSSKETCPRVVVMCSNKRRYTDGVDFLKHLQDKLNDKTTYIFRVFAYYDELHEYINKPLREQIKEIHDLDIVKGILALTATPDKIFEQEGFWSEIRLINLDILNEIDYIGFKDMAFYCIDDFFEKKYIRPSRFNYDELDRQTIGFIQHVLKKHPDILNDGTITFIPAHKRRIGHEQVRRIIFSMKPNAVVIVINGKEKCLQYNDKNGNTKTIQLISDNSKEVCEIISDIITLHKLENRPIVITGLLCVGMGQTLSHHTIGSFTSAIFSHLDLTNDEIYQLFGRITGRMKYWEKYVQTNVYCPKTIMERCKIMEICSLNMTDKHNGDCVTQTDYRSPMYETEEGESAIENLRDKKSKKSIVRMDDKDKAIATFKSQKRAIEFANDILGISLKIRKSSLATKELLVHGENPTRKYILSRMWGINKDTRARMVPIINGKWCVYWRPSLF